MSEVAVCRETWSHSMLKIYFLLRRATQTKEGEPGALFCDSVASVGKSGDWAWESLVVLDAGLTRSDPMLTENVDSAGLTRFRSGRPATFARSAVRVHIYACAICARDIATS